MPLIFAFSIFLRRDFLPPPHDADAADFAYCRHFRDAVLRRVRYASARLMMMPPPERCERVSC